MHYGKDVPIKVWGLNEQLINKAFDAYFEKSGESLNYIVDTAPIPELREIFQKAKFTEVLNASVVLL